MTHYCRFPHGVVAEQKALWELACRHEVTILRVDAGDILVQCVASPKSPVGEFSLEAMHLLAVRWG